MDMSLYMGNLLKLPKYEQVVQLRKDISSNPLLIHEPEVVQWIRNTGKNVTEEELILWRRKVNDL